MPPPISQLFDGWGLFEAYKDTELTPLLDKQGVALIVKSLLDHFDELSVRSTNREDEQLDVDEDEVPEPTVAG